MGLKTDIWASRQEFGPQGRDLGLKAEIRALRQGSESEREGGRRRRRLGRKKIPLYVKACVIDPFRAAVQKPAPRPKFSLLTAPAQMSLPCHTRPAAFLVACYATLHPALSVHPPLSYFFSGLCGLWTHRPCLNDHVTSNTAPALPHVTWVAMYPALFQSTDGSAWVVMRKTLAIKKCYLPTERPADQTTRQGVQSRDPD